MKRREFMRNLLGGGAAALVGMTVPKDLKPEEMALLEERVVWRWHGNELEITNLTPESIDVSAGIHAYVSIPPEIEHKYEWVYVLQRGMVLAS